MLKQLFKKKRSSCQVGLGDKQQKNSIYDIENSLMVESDFWEVNSEDALRVDILTSKSSAGRKKEKVLPFGQFIQPELWKNDPLPMTVGETNYLKEVAARPNTIKIKSLGFVSDSLTNSKLIVNHVKRTDIQVRHFSHTSVFTSDQYSKLDEISAWIIYTSDHSDGFFLDQFLDRYIDKASLFLFENMESDYANKKISCFLSEHGLMN